MFPEGHEIDSWVSDTMAHDVDLWQHSTSPDLAAVTSDSTREIAMQMQYPFRAPEGIPGPTRVLLGWAWPDKMIGRSPTRPAAFPRFRQG